MKCLDAQYVKFWLKGWKLIRRRADELAAAEAQKFETWVAWLENPSGTPELSEHFYSHTVPRTIRGLLPSRQRAPPCRGVATTG